MIKKHKPYGFTVFPNIAYVETTFLSLISKGKLTVQEFDNLDNLFKFAKVTQDMVERWDIGDMDPDVALAHIARAGDPKWEQHS